MKTNLKAYLAGKASIVDEALDRFLPPGDAHPSRIHEAMRYSVFAGGKRIRPVLTLTTASLFGGDEQAVLPAPVMPQTNVGVEGAGSENRDPRVHGHRQGLAHPVDGPDDAQGIFGYGLGRREKVDSSIDAAGVGLEYLSSARSQALDLEFHIVSAQSHHRTTQRQLRTQQ